MFTVKTADPNLAACRLVPPSKTNSAKVGEGSCLTIHTSHVNLQIWRPSTKAVVGVGDGKLQGRQRQQVAATAIVARVVAAGNIGQGG